MKEIYDKISYDLSKLTTKRYSTSFSLGIRFLSKDLHKPIYNIYGFVRLADEIVDTFHEYDKKTLLDEFKKETHLAIQRGISLNPILNAFQQTVNEYKIPLEQIDTFLKSMSMDLDLSEYDQNKYEEYILGSAEVVGLMCLRVFVRGDEQQYQNLEFQAMKLGSAFQKINFLRDLKADFHSLGRTYFPGVEMSEFNDLVKNEIELDIEKDFKTGYDGIKKLPKNARFGVYMAYMYYYKLFRKIKETPASVVLNNRIRIPDNKKYRIFISSYLKHQLNLV